MLDHSLFTSPYLETCEGFALQMSIIVLFEQIKSGEYRDKSGEISD
jgi:hypothetical protein